MTKTYHVVVGAPVTIRDLRIAMAFKRANNQDPALVFSEREMDHMTFDNGSAAYVFIRNLNKYIIRQSDVNVLN